MAREFARIRVNIWINDDDWRDLTPAAQHLYKVLLTSPDLSYCGVTDWRPGRLAARARGWTAEQVVVAAMELTERLYLIPDPDTEEVLIRSFIRHDGLMKEARVAVSMVKAFGGVASNTIRGVIVHELRRLHNEDASLNGWRTTRGEPGQALQLLRLNAIDPADLAQGLADRLGVGLGVGLAQTPPNVWGSVWGSVSGSTSPTPAPTPTPSTSDEVEKELTTLSGKPDEPDQFDEFWKLYPRKDDKIRARKAWAKLTKKIPAQQIIDGVRAYPFKPDRQYQPLPSSWLNGQRWEDEGVATTLYDVSRLPEPGTGWSREQLDMVLGQDTWEVPEPPAEMNEDDGYLWQQAEGRRHFGLRVQAALEATGRTA